MKRSRSPEHRPFLSRIVVTLVLSLATFRHIPSVSTPPLRAPRPQNRVHLQGVAKAAAASMKSHRNGSLVLKRTVGVAGKTLDAFRKQAGQLNSSSKHYSQTEAALWPCTCYVLHANEFSRVPTRSLYLASPQPGGVSVLLGFGLDCSLLCTSVHGAHSSRADGKIIYKER